MRFSKPAGGLSLIIGLALATSIAVGAAESDNAISQSFVSKQSLSTGMVVSFATGNNEGTVEAATTNSVKRLAGIVGEKQLVELSDGQGSTQVVVSGRVLTLVSNLNGDIKAGDKITPSPIAGVGMKAQNTTHVVGVVQADWSTAENITSRQVKASNGSTKTVKVGLLPVQVGISYYQAGGSSDDSYIPTFLQRTADDIAGHRVDPLRILITGLVFMLGIGAAGIIFYSSISSSIISIGRNPLSSPTIWRSLLEAGVAGLAVVLATFISVYLLLSI